MYAARRFLIPSLCVGLGVAGRVAYSAVALDKDEFRKFRVSKIEPLTADTKRYTVSFPNESDESGVSVCSAISMRLTVDGMCDTGTTPALGSEETCCRSRLTALCLLSLCCAHKDLALPLESRIPPGIG